MTDDDDEYVLPLQRASMPITFCRPEQYDASFTVQRNKIKTLLIIQMGDGGSWWDKYGQAIDQT